MNKTIAATLFIIIILTVFCGCAAENKAAQPSVPEETVTSAVPLNVKADGVCGENLTWVLYDNGTLVISGAGEMDNYGVNRQSGINKPAPWDGNEVKKVIIENAVTSVGKEAFRNFSNSLLSDVSLPDGLEKIEEYSFEGAVFSEIQLPETLKHIGTYAFLSCDNLTRIFIPKNVEILEEGAFHHCDSLSAFTVDTENEFYSADEYGVLFNKDKTELIQFPQGSTLEEYTVPASVVRIKAEAFQNCLNLKKVTIQNGVSQLEERVFYDCSGLETLILPSEGITEIPEQFLSGCCSLKTIHIPQSVESILQSAFSQCESLRKIDFPEGVEFIGRAAFSECRNLTKIQLPDTLQEIQSAAFFDCGNLKNVHIPKCLTKLYSESFDSKHIKSFTVDPANEHYYADDFGVLFNKEKTELVCFPGASGITEYDIPDTVTNATIAYCSSLQKIHFPNGVKTIYLSNCPKLVSCEIPDSATDTMIQYCEALTDIRIPESFTEVPSYFLRGCTGITKITVPANVTVIRFAAFSGCSGLKEIRLPGSLQIIEDFAFAMGDIDAEDSVLEIYYSGTKKTWDTVQIGENNEALFHVNIHFAE